MSQRLLWSKERSDHWWDRIVKNSFSDTDWYENFRMTHTTFNFLCGELKDHLIGKDTVMRKAIPVEKKVALTLWFLATGSDYRSVGHIFGVSRSTVFITVIHTCLQGIYKYHLEQVWRRLWLGLKTLVSLTVLEQLMGLTSRSSCPGSSSRLL